MERIRRRSGWNRYFHGQILTDASSRVEKGIANSAAPSTTSSLDSAPKARTNLAAQDKTLKSAQFTHMREKKKVKLRGRCHITSMLSPNQTPKNMSSKTFGMLYN